MTLRLRSGVKFQAAASVLVLFLLTAWGCGTSRVQPHRSGADENLMRLNRSARIAYEYGQLEQAAGLYRQALDRAFLSDDRKAVVDAQYNLAVCMLGLRSYDQAQAWVHRALNELKRDGQNPTADILYLEAAILFRVGKLDRAWQITDQILSTPQKPPAAVEGKAHYLRGLIADQRGDTDQLARELDALAKSSDPGRQADRKELSGRMAMAEGNWEAAIDAFDHTARLRREKLDYVEMAQALALAADACQRAGKYSAAATRYFRAGRSAVQQHNHPDALKWLNSAAQNADQAGDEPLNQEVRTYLQTIQPP